MVPPAPVAARKLAARTNENARLRQQLEAAARWSPRFTTDEKTLAATAPQPPAGHARTIATY